ncbi:alpha/beta fold hydrolase [Saccharomonospora saliphila]|uniref:alpha/beta fold hydrolase n=1 Tax=Saccharomonospora saliphila TaxID=369829 RepID=UPI0003727DB5|nr:alpha/beta hydrolase [Saccharomonospora saliphila]
MFATADDGTRIAYDSVPGPRPVLLLHGFATDSRRTWHDTGWLRALDGRGYVTVDLRGHGESDTPESGYSPGRLARDALAVLDAAEVPTVDVVTYSMGGVVGWELARLAPGRVGALVLGGIDGRPVEAPDMHLVRDAMRAKGLQACIDGMAGSRIEGSAGVPVLVVAGENDEIAAAAPELATGIGAEFVPLPRRTHLNAVSSRAFKQAALDFLDGRPAAR